MARMHKPVSIAIETTCRAGGAALAGSELEYTVLVTNIGNVPAYAVIITDDLGTELYN